ncbi:hypothetical protein PF005_g11236 [Phytophthora fragariae]|uniref:Uncharacterized protein n=2 Tax=Phytophthora TaxID=4783 RepID=A0A6A3TWT9_9STRA|nr:hypothetical protein PF003_g14075 [Phytophthora fragariae]KAE8978678.1 hypothetical protein PR002_g24646 [Phytophthora rubi]KAE8932867.1 hypothetical protein PF009_g17122 [Phytophthora fragariae]KAE8999131.1 hypothetical protein PF011_g14749 [Phytophthora fragariae]KAE9071879.1 hypothetical protein PF010_g25700 [Phytophthora fragariae]
MFPSIDELPTATSLLMQCGYRSKVCTKARATKIDGSLHKLCEFHRRKANANQQRLHQRQRETRVKRRRTQAVDDRPMKKERLAAQSPADSITIDPIPYAAADTPLEFGVNVDKYYRYPTGFFAEELAPPELGDCRYGAAGAAAT